MNTDVNAKDSFAAFLEQAEQSPIYWEELAILGFTRSVLTRLQALGLTKKNLSEKLEVSPAYVTKLIGGSNNFTLKTMVKIAMALESELEVSLTPVLTRCSYGMFHQPIRKPHTAADHEDLALAA